MSSPSLSECPIQRDLAPRSEGGLFSPTLPPCFCFILPPCFCLILAPIPYDLSPHFGLCSNPTSVHTASELRGLLGLYSLRLQVDLPTCPNCILLLKARHIPHPPPPSPCSICSPCDSGDSHLPFISSRISDQAEGRQSGSLSTPAERRHKSPEAVHSVKWCTASGL